MDNLAQREQKWFRRTCMVCLFACAFMCACCVYCTLLLQRMQEVCKTCAAGGVAGDLDPSNTVIQNYQASFQDIDGSLRDEVQQMRLKRSTEVKSKKKKKKDRKKKSKLKAAHYESMASTAFIQKTFPPYDEGNLTKTCLYIAEMAGTLCRTQDYVTNNTENAIRAFKPAEWVKSKNNPFTMNDNGFLTARYTGVHLIYAQVLFYDNKELQILRLVQKRRDRHGDKEIQDLTCHESVDSAGPVRYHSCGVTGLFYLTKGDVIYLENVFGDVKLNLRSSTTYIGAVLLK